MPIPITIPSPGESITEVILGPWHKQSGQWVEKDQTIVEIESDKVTLEVPAPESGVLSIDAQEGAEKEVGDVIGNIDTDAPRPAAAEGDSAASAPAAANEVATATTSDGGGSGAGRSDDGGNGSGVRATSVARKMAADRGVDLARIHGSGPSGRVTKSDVLAVATAPEAVTASTIDVAGARGVRREKMSKLRRRIAERLVEAQHTAAMLTTFNEADMSAVMALRKRHKEEFSTRYDVNLGFMSFFVKACASALMGFPRVNAYIVGRGGEELEFHDYIDISVAVGTDKGLVVPVLRNVEQMSFAQVELGIKDLAERARAGKLAIEDMTGGTFTISNGGVYGSLNSTPILNPPQSGILGMHRIMNRAVEDPDNPGNIVLRPMMYLALSYDHRIVDGAEAVGFLVHVKQCIEDPQRLMLGL